MADKESHAALNQFTQRILERLAYSVHLFASGMASRQEALQYILEASVDLTSADFGTIHLYDDETQTLRPAAFLGPYQNFVKISPYDTTEPDWAETLRTNLSEFIRSVITSTGRKPLFHDTARDD